MPELRCKKHALKHSSSIPTQLGKLWKSSFTVGGSSDSYSSRLQPFCQKLLPRQPNEQNIIHTIASVTSVQAHHHCWQHHWRCFRKKKACFGTASETFPSMNCYRRSAYEWGKLLGLETSDYQKNGQYKSSMSYWLWSSKGLTAWKDGFIFPSATHIHRKINSSEPQQAISNTSSP